MASLNQVTLIGRLANDPELRYTGNNKAVVSFTLAVDRPFKNQETGEKKTDFFRCKAWGQKAEFVNQYVQKGRLVALGGRIELNDYVGQDGQKRYTTDIIADQVETLDAPKDRGQADAGHQAPDEYVPPASQQRGPVRQASAPPPAMTPTPPRHTAPARPARPAPAQPAYPADDEFDDSDPFAGD